jgi:hypothetical protein
VTYDFKYGKYWLSELGGRTAAPPSLEIAQRKTELIEIPGRDGEDVIDYGYYGNVEISREIALIGADADGKTRLLVNAYAYLQGYQEFRDTLHSGCYTQAILMNFGEFSRDILQLHRGVLVFSRLPFWYYDNGNNLKLITWATTVLSDALESDKDGYPLIRVNLPSAESTSNIKLRLVLQTTGKASSVDIELSYSGSSAYVELDCEAGTIVRVQSGARAQFGFFDRLSFNKQLRIRVNEYKIGGEAVVDSPTMYIVPRWRCLL